MSNQVARFVPAYRLITAITNASQAVVTFDEDHTYTPGEIISFRVSPAYGMFQINNMQARVLSITDDTVTTDINSLTWNAFTIPTSPGAYPAMVVPAGSGIIPASMPATVNLEDAFDQLPGH